MLRVTVINTWHICRWYTSDFNVVTTTISAFAPHWYQGLYSRVKTLLSSVCSQEVITCFISASVAITCQPGASQGCSERENNECKIGTDP